MTIDILWILYRFVDMKNQRMFWLLLLLVTVLDSARAQVEPSYFLNGGNLQLRPTVTVPITSIIWKHNGDLLAEWIQDNVDLTYYGDYDGRTTLDIKTGHLDIRNMNETKDSGSYTLEINNKVHGQSYDAKAITEVPKPSIWITPVACDGQQDNCTMICEGDIQKAEPVTYTWMEDGSVLEGEKAKELVIFRTKTKEVKTFSCRMKNPLSEKESDPKDNPFFDESSSNDGSGGVVPAVVSVLVLLVVGGLAAAGYVKKDYIKSRFFSSGSGDAENPPAANQPNSNSNASAGEKLPMLHSNNKEEDGKTDAPDTAPAQAPAQATDTAPDTDTAPAPE